jgi:NADH:ubiquinone oxidoreductase subunit 2 (subunit N)
MVIYILTAINIFIILIYIESVYEKEINDFEQIRGLFYKNPLLA